jgi:hypothetical protein
VLLAAGGWFSVGNLLNPLLITLDRVALGTAVSAAAVGYYTGAYEVATKLQVVTGAVFPVFFPAIAHAAVAAPRRAAALVSASARLVLAALVPAAIALPRSRPSCSASGSARRTRAAAPAALRILAAGLLVNCVGQSAFHALQAVGHARLTALFHAAQVAPYAAALWWVAPRHGPAGVAASSACGSGRRGARVGGARAGAARGAPRPAARDPVPRRGARPARGGGRAPGPAGGEGRRGGTPHRRPPRPRVAGARATTTSAPPPARRSAARGTSCARGAR